MLRFRVARHIFPGTLLYFETCEDGGEPVRARRLIDWAAKHSYDITLAVSLGCSLVWNRPRKSSTI
jgi:hypothetical protein